ncbi:TetR family transcriptional regulator [Burkholderia gladioli]|uniref:TetR family transcriptional regulator n=1 Tax=Burkholderia gladioli TaxID=28095 RepID=UPI003C7CFA48
MDRIAERAGLHKMAIYRIFGSRAALLDEVAGRLCDGERAGTRSPAPPTARRARC